MGAADDAKQLVQKMASSGDDRQQNLSAFMAGSKTPPVLYHGTTSPEISEFRTFSRGPKLMDGLGAHFGSPEAAQDRNDKNVGKKPVGQNILPVHVNIKNPPLKRDGSFMSEGELQSHLSRIATSIGIPKDKHRGMAIYGGVKPDVTRALKEELIRRGHDGIAYINSHEGRGSTSWVAFHPHQIKSAVGNQGTFDSTTPEITKAFGGALHKPHVGRKFKTRLHVGPIHSAVAGRTDHLPMHVPSGSYVLPADIVSAHGEGSTIAGFKVMRRMFGGTPYGGNSGPYGQGSGPYGEPINRASGGEADGEDEGVPIVAAGGELVLSPAQVRWAGGGDLDAGHKVLDEFVKRSRAKLIKTLKKLPPPKVD